MKLIKEPVHDDILNELYDISRDMLNEDVDLGLALSVSGPAWNRFDWLSIVQSRYVDR